jgi:beta-lactamase superfamily II metal-dependent hydrolase
MAKRKNSRSSSSAERDAKRVAKAIQHSKHPKLLIFLIVLLLVLGFGAGASYYFLVYKKNQSSNTSSSISSSSQVSSVVSSTSQVSGQTSVGADGIVENAVYDNFRIYFMELGNSSTGDSIYIKAGDTDILIDAGSETSSATTIESYVDQYCTDGKLEYVIVTHGDFDHISGMYGNSSSGSYNGILYHYKVGTIIDTGRTNKTTAAYTNYTTARSNAVSNGAVYYTAGDCFKNVAPAKSQFTLADGITLDILYNKYYYENSTDENNYSVCSLFTYGSHHFLLTGDLELDGETALAGYYDGTTAEKTLPTVDLFKAGHHGSKTSSNDVLLSKIQPKMCCVCCCAGGSEYTNINDNTFPTQAFITRIGKYTSRVYVTSMIDEAASRTAGSLVRKSLNGAITVSCDGTSVGVSASDNLTKLKESAWFTETVYLTKNTSGSLIICSGKGKTDFFTSSTSGATAYPRRTWPTDGK